MVATPKAMAFISPMFIVRDLDETMRFYCECLGFEATFVEPEIDPFFAILQRDGVQIFFKMIGEGIDPLPNPHRHPWAKWDAYVYSPDPDALAEELRRRRPDKEWGVVETEDGLRGLTVKDPNGYVLFFGRPSTA